MTSKLGSHVLDLIGNTPLLRLDRLRHWLGEQNKVELLAKAEYANPGGSVKDRPALRMIREGIREKKLTREKIIMDSSSGNTGIAYAMIGAALGYRVELVIPENAGEKRRIAETFGANVVLTDPLEGSDGAIVEAQARYKKHPDRYFMPDQYNNPNNWKAHYDTTAMEIWKQTEGRVTHFVAGIGTSGTLMGTGRRLKELNPKIEIIAVEPADALHGLEGLKHMDSSIVPGIYDAKVHDRKVSVYTEDSYEMVCRVAREEGLLVGYSSGAALQGAFEVAQKLKEGVVVTVLPDRGDRYLFTRFWDEVLTFWGKEREVRVMPPTITFTAEAWKSLVQLSEQAYPFEGCGLLLGPLTAEKRAERVVTLKNILRDEGRGRFDFSFSPKEFMEAQRQAEQERLDVVGIFHTHPDHPPRPSPTDASQPMLAGWINIIAAVYGGRFKEAKAWWREDEQTPFVETNLIAPR